MAESCRHPHVEMDSADMDGNALAVVTTVSGALRNAGVPRGEIAAYQRDALSGDYAYLLSTTGRWVSLR